MPSFESNMRRFPVRCGHKLSYSDRQEVPSPFEHTSANLSKPVDTAIS